MVNFISNDGNNIEDPSRMNSTPDIRQVEPTPVIQKIVPTDIIDKTGGEENGDLDTFVNPNPIVLALPQTVIHSEDSDENSALEGVSPQKKASSEQLQSEYPNIPQSLALQIVGSSDSKLESIVNDKEVDKFQKQISGFSDETVKEFATTNASLFHQILSGDTSKIAEATKELEDIELDKNVKKFANMFPGYSESVIKNFAKTQPAAFNNAIATGSIDDQISIKKSLDAIEWEEIQYFETFSLQAEDESHKWLKQYQAVTPDQINNLKGFKGVEGFSDETIKRFLASNPEYKNLATNSKGLDSAELMKMMVSLETIELNQKIAESMLPDEEELIAQKELDEKKAKAKELLKERLEGFRELSQEQKEDFLKIFGSRLTNSESTGEVEQILRDLESRIKREL